MNGVRRCQRRMTALEQGERLQWALTGYTVFSETGVQFGAMPLQVDVESAERGVRDMTALRCARKLPASARASRSSSHFSCMARVFTIGVLRRAY